MKKTSSWLTFLGKFYRAACQNHDIYLFKPYIDMTVKDNSIKNIIDNHLNGIYLSYTPPNIKFSNRMTKLKTE